MRAKSVYGNTKADEIADNGIILIALGSNLWSSPQLSPLATCEAALFKLREHGVIESRGSGWYASSPVPSSGQNWYINKVSVVTTELLPEELLEALLDVENDFNRKRSKKWGERTLDLDLLAFNEMVCENFGNHRLNLPHPRMLERRFIVEPLTEILPKWVHPIYRREIKDLSQALGEDQKVLRISV